MSGLVLCVTVSQLCGATMFLIFANALEASEFGILSGALFLQQFISTLNVSGFRSVVIRELVQQPNHRQSITGTYLLLSGGSGLLIFAVTALLLSFFPLAGDERWAYLLIALGHIGASLFPNAMYDADQAQVRGASIIAITEMLGLACVAVCSFFDFISLPVAAVLVAGKWVTSAVVGLADYRFTRDDFQPRFDRSQMRTIWKSSRLMALATMLNVAPLALGVPLTCFLFGANEGGLFAIGAFAFRTHSTIIGLLTRTIYPHVSGVQGESVSFIKRMLAVYASVTISLAVAGVVCGALVLRYCLASEYSAAHLTLVLMLVAATIRAGGVLGNMYLVARKQERTLLILAIGSAGVFVLILLLPLGISGKVHTASAVIGASLVMTASLGKLFRR